MIVVVAKIKAKTAFNTIPSIIKRFAGNLRMSSIYLAANLGYRKNALAEKKRLRQYESQMQPDSGDGLDLFVGC